MIELFMLVMSTIAVALVVIGLIQFVFWLRIGKSALLAARNREQISRLMIELGERKRPVLIVGLIACLNEEAVIGRTVTAFLAQSDSARVVVVDDGSDDDTSGAALRAGRDRVIVARRDLPNARTGKGPALNSGFLALVEYVRSTGVDPSDVVVCVMDADGILSDGCLDAALTLFSDSKIGGAQIPVEIRNRPTGHEDDERNLWVRLIALYQDYEFYALSARQQVARGATGSVSLGGNGQFTRLSALLGVSETEPWSSSLTEDLDLAISLMVRGWELQCLPDHSVNQEGVESMRKLVRQRTRWMQGHILCSKRIPEVWRAPRVPFNASIEVISYLSVPCLMIMPWSIICLINIPLTISYIFGVWMSPTGVSSRLFIVFVWYAMSFAPHIITGYLYWRSREGETSKFKAFLLSHGFAIYTGVTFLATWKAAIRIARGEHGWAKTERVATIPPS